MVGGTRADCYPWPMDIRTIATRFRTADWTTEFADTLTVEAPWQLGHTDCSFLAKQARAQLVRGRVGRARNWVALGLYVDSTNVIAHFKRVGLFRASKYNFQGKVLLLLVESILETRSVLHLDSETNRYLECVRSLLTLSVGALRTYHTIVSQLKKRKKHALKSLVVTVDKMFLTPRPADLTLDCDNPRHYTIEEHATALSFLIHTFATHCVVHDQNFNFIDERGIEDGVYDGLLVAACALCGYKEAELLVDVFSYSASGAGDVIDLRPEDIRLEQSIRLGYIQAESQKNLSLLEQIQGEKEPVVSVRNLSTKVYETLGVHMIRLRERPLPRYALFFPEDMAELVGPFRENRLFKEDVIYLSTVAKEQFVHPGELLDFQLADGLTMLDVVKIRRFLNFLRDLMAQKLLPLMETDPKIAMRSLLPVFRRDELVRLLKQCVSREAAEAFLRVTTYDRAKSRGVLDVLYQPLILGHDHYLVPMNVLCSSDLLRNLLYTERKKVQQNDTDSPMQRLVADALRRHFRHVAEGTRLRVDGRSLEIDIVAIVDRQLLLVECKSAFHPCGVHELRTSYEHILKAGKQLDRLQEALQRKEVRRRLCQSLGWDPNDVEGTSTCVVTGNRIFNGYTIGNHPVRPAYEMMNMVVAGTIGVGDEKFCVWRKSHFEAQDLLDYLAGSTVHVDLFGAFVKAARSYVLGGMTMNVWTYVLDAESVARNLTTKYPRVTENEGP